MEQPTGIFSGYVNDSHCAQALHDKRELEAEHWCCSPAFPWALCPAPLSGFLLGMGQAGKCCLFLCLLVCLLLDLFACLFICILIYLFSRLCDSRGPLLWLQYGSLMSLGFAALADLVTALPSLGKLLCPILWDSCMQEMLLVGAGPCAGPGELWDLWPIVRGACGTDMQGHPGSGLSGSLGFLLPHRTNTTGCGSTQSPVLVLCCPGWSCATSAALHRSHLGPLISQCHSAIQCTFQPFLATA